MSVFFLLFPLSLSFLCPLFLLHLIAVAHLLLSSSFLLFLPPLPSFPFFSFRAATPTDTIESLLNDKSSNIGITADKEESKKEKIKSEEKTSTKGLLDDASQMGNTLDDVDCPDCKNLEQPDTPQPDIAHSDIAQPATAQQTAAQPTQPPAQPLAQSAAQAGAEGAAPPPAAPANRVGPAQIASDALSVVVEEKVAKELNGDEEENEEEKNWWVREEKDGVPMTTKKMMRLFMRSAKKLQRASSLKEIVAALRLMKHAHGADQTLQAAAKHVVVSL